MEPLDVPKHCRELPRGVIIFSSKEILLLLGNNGDTHWTLPQKDIWVDGFTYIIPRRLKVGGGLFFFIDFGNASEMELRDKYGDIKWLSEEEFKEDQAPLTQNTMSTLSEAWKYDKMLESRTLHHMLVNEGYIYGFGPLVYQEALSSVLRTALKLLAEDNESLATLNKIGFFFKFKCELFTCPGIWFTLCSANFIYHSSSEKMIAQMTFSPGFRLYNPGSESGKELWNTWRNNPQNLEKPNQWETQVISAGESMKDRMGVLGAPNHSEFYEQYRFGAILGYTSIVIIDARAICQPTSVPGVSKTPPNSQCTTPLEQSRDAVIHFDDPKAYDLAAGSEPCKVEPNESTDMDMGEILLAVNGIPQSGQSSLE